MRIVARGVCFVAFVALAGLMAACGTTADNTSTPTSVASPGPGSGAPALGSKAGPPDDPGPPKNGGKLVVGIEAEPEGMDSTRYAFSSSGHFVASAVFDPLVTLDADGKTVPYLAKSFTGSADFKTWMIELPTGVQFHDGTALDSAVLVKNLEAYRKSIITSGNLVMVTSVQATDATHVVIVIDRPIVQFPAIFASQVGYVEAAAMIDDPQYVDKPIGTGPFVFDHHIKDSIWAFKKNTTYWRSGLPHLDNIDIRPIADNAERLKELQSGGIDMLNARSGNEITELRKSDMKRVENVNGEEQFLALNTQQEPFNSLTARQAVATAIDAARYRKEVTLDTESPANGPFAPGQPGYLEDNGYPSFDLDRAKKLVAQYQSETGKPLEFAMLTQADLNTQSDTQLVATMLDAAGIKVTVSALPQINLIAAVASGGYQMARFRLFGHPIVDQDASTFWRGGAATSAVSLNFPRFADPKIDEAIDTALATNDEAVRTKAWETINRSFATNLPYIWLSRAAWILAANDRVQGIYAATNGTVQLIGPKTWMADLWVNS